MRLSVAIVCRNNEPTIGRTLESVAGLADEIVAVDSGSTDGTLGMLERAGARVIRTEWKGHVATKQMALEACSGEWILCLDSDESVDPELRTSMERVLGNPDPAIAAARVNRKVWYAGRYLEHAWQPEWRLRLARRGAARWGGFDPHDKLELAPDRVGAKVIDLQGTLRHDSFATIEEHLGKQVGHARIAARSLKQEGVRGSRFRLLISPPGAFLKQLVLKSAWRDGWRGWAAAGSAAAGALLKHLILLELWGKEGEEGSTEGDPSS